MDDIRHSNCTDLILILSNTISDKRTLEILEDECINGKSFVDLTQEDITAMKIKMGPAKELLQIINSLKKPIPEGKITEGSFIVNEDGSLSECRQDLTVTEQNMPSEKNKRKIEDHCETKKIQKTSDDKTIEIDYKQPSTSKNIDIYKFSRYNTIEEVVLQNKQGKSILKAAKSILSESDRRLLIRIVVQELVATHSPYPPHEAKLELARALVTEFPKLKNESSRLGFEHYYDPDTKLGFIQYRLQTLQKKLPNEEKKYNKYIFIKDDIAKENVSNLNLLTENVLEEKINWMKNKFPSDSNKESIKGYLSQTFINRRNWILEKNPTATEIFGTYERLIDYDGDMIDHEFSLMFSGSEDKFIVKFPTHFMPRIMKYAEFIKSNAVEKNNDIDDDALKSLIVLLTLLPVSNATKNRQRVKKSIKSKEPQQKKVPTIDARTSLVEVVPLGTNIDDFIKEKQRTALISSTTVQPYLIYVSGEAKKYFIVVDKIILNRTNQSNAIAAFDLLFKIYYVLNVEYPILLQNFYNFIDTYVFEITERKAVGVVTSLYINLKNIVLDNNTPLNIDESDGDSE